jgi:hypothetical protein
MDHRSAEAPLEGFLEPLCLEPIRAQGIELSGELVTLLVVRRQSQAARPHEGVAGKLLEPVEGTLGLPPQPDRPLAADRLGRDVERGGSAAQREAAVPSTGAARDLAGLVQADLQPGFGETQRRRAAGYPAADDDDVRRPVELPLGDRRCRLVEPVRDGQVRREVAVPIGTKARLPTSLMPLTVL